jgi:hypothetical protein
MLILTLAEVSQESLLAEISLERQGKYSLMEEYSQPTISATFREQKKRNRRK